METVNIARLRNGLCAYLERVKGGEEFLVRDRNRAVARLVPVEAGMDDEDEAVRLFRAGILTAPKPPLDVDALFRIPVGRGNRKRVLAAIRAERGDDR